MHHSRGFFITGTDTCVGKSRIAVGVMRALQQQGLHVVGMKPVASGCETTPAGLRNEDAVLLQQYASQPIEYDTLNPYAFAPAIAPHIAAAQAGTTIELAPIMARFQQLQAMSDAVVVEGAGGWLVPLNEQLSIANLACAMKLPVILVVAIRLGCINHALLSAQAIRASGCNLAGWVANHVESETPLSAENIAAIAARIDAPLLGSVPYMPELSVERIAAALNLSLIRG